jgi:hypothetical protein
VVVCARALHLIVSGHSIAVSSIGAHTSTHSPRSCTKFHPLGSLRARGVRACACECKCVARAGLCVRGCERGWMDACVRIGARVCVYVRVCACVCLCLGVCACACCLCACARACTCVCARVCAA